jgi:hypothetical protein
MSDILYAPESKPVPMRKVLRLFAFVYLTPIVVYAATSSILGGLGNGFLVLFISLYFPCGLTAIFLGSDGRLSSQEFLTCTVLGYVIYLAVVCFGLAMRKSRSGVVVALITFVTLFGINVIGCKHVAAHETENVHAP